MGNTRFTGQILRSGSGANQKWFSDYPVGFSPDYVWFWDDFTGAVINATNDWVVVKDSGAAVALVTDAAGGEVSLTSTATTDDDGASIRGMEIFLPAAGRSIWFEARVKLSSAADQDAFIGLCEKFTTDPEASLLASNRIGFQINDGSASILCKTEASDTETSTASGVLAVDATYVRLGFQVLGTGAVRFFVNRQLVATHSTNIPATELAPVLFSLSGSVTGTRTLIADYISAVATR